MNAYDLENGILSVALWEQLMDRWPPGDARSDMAQGWLRTLLWSRNAGVVGAAFVRARCEAFARRRRLGSWAAVIRHTERAMAVEKAERKVLESACEFAQWGGDGISVCYAAAELLDAREKMKRGGARWRR